MKYTALISDMLKIFPDLSPREQAQQIDSYLTSSGYRILAPGEMDMETLEAAAKVADGVSKTEPIAGPYAKLIASVMGQSGRTIAAAIRALGGEEG